MALWLRAARPHAGPADGRGSRLWLAGVALASAAAAASIPPAVWAWGRELAEDFSGSRATASYLLESGLDREVIAGHPAEMAQAVLPYLEKLHLYYPARSEWGSHMWWNAKMLLGRSISDDELFPRLDRAFRPERPVVLLVVRRLAGADAHGYALLFESPPSIVTDGHFRMYGRHVASVLVYPGRCRETTDPRGSGLLAD